MKIFTKKTYNFLPPVRNILGERTKIFVGVSGGVDSSVSAALLIKKGYDVTGVFMRTYYPPQLQCDWREERTDAVRVCQHLKIPFLECDLEKEYKTQVFEYMITSYAQGITPNPDVFCNKYVKFGGFLQWALTQGADYIATGHYAQHILENKEYNTDHHSLVMGKDSNKDQTYFLYQLQQDQLKRALFPIGNLDKADVRKLAKKHGLFTAEKKDSQGLCFVGPVDMQDFLKDYIQQDQGDVLSIDGEIIGTHTGAAFLTIGQRTGFIIDPKYKTPNMSKLFIVSKNVHNNTITVSGNTTNYDPQEITIHQASWIGQAPVVGESYDSRIRHRGLLKKAFLKDVKNNEYIFSFKVPHSGVARGQSLVLYSNSTCLGGGIVI